MLFQNLEFFLLKIFCKRKRKNPQILYGLLLYDERMQAWRGKGNKCSKSQGVWKIIVLNLADLALRLIADFPVGFSDIDGSQIYDDIGIKIWPISYSWYNYRSDLSIYTALVKRNRSVTMVLPIVEGLKNWPLVRIKVNVKIIARSTQVNCTFEILYNSNPLVMC